MTRDRLEHLLRLQQELSSQTQLCEVLAGVIPVDVPRNALLRRLRDLGTSHIQFGAALRRFAESPDLEGESRAV